MIFKREEEIPSFCVIHGVPKKLDEFEFIGIKFQNWKCEQCEKELEEWRKQAKKEIVEIKLKGKKRLKLEMFSIE